MPVKVALGGAAEEIEPLLRLLSQLPSITVIGLYCPTQPAPKLTDACIGLGIPVAQHFRELGQTLQPDIVLLHSANIQPNLDNYKIPPPLLVYFDQPDRLVAWINSLYETWAETEEQKEKYLSALNAATEGVQIINDQGVIEYINPAFSKITGIHPSERIGASIYAVSPDGSGARVLKSGTPAVGVRNQAVGSCSEVISNGAPIVIRGKKRGAVVVFQEVTDILRLSKELSTSKAIIESLSDELGYAKTSKYTFNDLIGQNKKMLEAINLSKRAAGNDSTILITGESGTGKEIIANAIHYSSPRWNKPFITVNCASIPDSLLESELFGHEKGAFTGADKLKVGKFELANNGTIFLDEIGDLNFNVQAKLLRVLQEKEIERVGNSQSLAINVKILAATNKNLAEMVQKGLFRADLFYRLQVIHVQLPPLRERKDDIPLLVDHIMNKLCRKHGKPVPAIELAVLQALTAYDWPGNIRELENVLTRALTISDNGVLTADKVRFPCKPAVPIIFEEDEIMPLADMEKLLIIQALKKYGHTTVGKQAAAKALRISLGTLYNKIRAYKIEQE